MKKLLGIIVITGLIFAQSCKDDNEYDYRNAFIGFYKCEVKHRWVIDSNGTWITHYSIYQDTIEVIKNSDYKMINISSLTDLNFNFRDSTFMGYHTYGKFFADSIRYYYFATPAALFSWDYKGAKIK